MSHYSQGKPTKQAHKGIPEGQFEEEQGHLGFFGPVSHLIRKNPSTRWTAIEGDLKPHMYDLVKEVESNKLDGSNEELKRVLHNNCLSIYWRHLKPSSQEKALVEKNADGDFIYFCHKGEGQIFTEYGLLSYKPGSYIIIPKALAYSFVPTKLSSFFVIENKTSHFREPDRGMLGRNAIYDSEAIQRPDLEALNKILKNEKCFTEIKIKHTDSWTKFKLDSTLFDVVGWKGDLYPFVLHVDDLMPVMSHRSHLPPSAHSTFVAKDFVICTFLPRPLEEDSDALRVPFYHQNIDYDEVLFYHDGDFFSRDNLHSGMMSFHPAGFPHGPHPKALKSIKEKTHTNEYAVMVDSRWPLKVDKSMSDIEVKDYWKSWM